MGFSGRLPYVAIEQGRHTYNIETEITYNEQTDDSEESEPTLNDLPAKFYARDLFYKKILCTRQKKITH
jgi:hypothetical protein